MVWCLSGCGIRACNIQKCEIDVGHQFELHFFVERQIFVNLKNYFYADTTFYV